MKAIDCRVKRRLQPIWIPFCHRELRENQSRAKTQRVKESKINDNLETADTTRTLLPAFDFKNSVFSVPSVAINF